MQRKNWTREELIVAFNLYCKIPFSKINYKHKDIIELATAIGRTPSAVAWKLVNFASLDSSLAKRGIKGATNAGKLDKEIFEEFQHNWQNLIEESELLYNQLFNKKEELLIENETEMVSFKEGKEQERMVKIRVNQSFFRQSVLASYEFSCCITGISINDLLIASHIIPWAKDELNRLNPSNGLCLNAIHDKAFDRGLITIMPDYTIKISERIMKEKNNPFLEENFKKIEGKSINLPQRFLPNPDFLSYHNQHIFK